MSEYQLSLLAGRKASYPHFFLFQTFRRDSIPEPHADEGVEYYGYGEYPDAETLAKSAFSLLATAEIARRHFVS